MNSIPVPDRFTLFIALIAVVAALSLVAAYRMNTLDINGAVDQAMQAEMLRDNGPIVD